ncbi:hypothetical protein IPC41_29660 [Pseudomonas aeruginosa]|nr:hypothetical protein [Pseudomonas aeruginosa]MCO2367236.1 hypothetical protein [Pseudomonas aeruginosa]PBL95458.1 hypothetical protein B8B57_29350 [Pseudomonas aeruginosa]PBM93339.1 hypothetical protein B8B64_23320 [Pseudomonas aeruginosa]RQE43344.1 hypothetical protein IPC309_29265 [Pseudomonas aeruginosa]
MLAKTLKALLLLCLIQAARTVADPVKGRAPGSSEQLHRSGERKHGRSAPLNAFPLKQPPLGSVGQLLRPALPSPRRQERDDKGRALGVNRLESYSFRRKSKCSLLHFVAQ